jgi:hypothetical protein
MALSQPYLLRSVAKGKVHKTKCHDVKLVLPDQCCWAVVWSIVYGTVNQILLPFCCFQAPLYLYIGSCFIHNVSPAYMYTYTRTLLIPVPLWLLFCYDLEH